MTEQKTRIARCASIAALSILTLAMNPARASADTLELVCASASGNEWHISVDLDKHQVRETYSYLTNVQGPFDASITDTSIRWTSPGVRSDHANIIDRTTGSFTETSNEGISNGKCRVAAKKF